MQIEFENLKIIIADSSYLRNGAITEQVYSSYLSQHFPNSEFFWKSFIVPATNRIFYPSNPDEDNTNVRLGVAQEIRDIGSFHYSIFINLVYAYKAIENKQVTSFDYFYIHLGITCDLIEEFLLKLYFLILDCTKIESTILTQLTKEEFLKIAENWYDLNYSTLFEQYYKKGKPNPIKIPPRKFLLDEYFEQFLPWKNYKTVSNEIKQYRNTIVHHHKLAFPRDASGLLYVPKKNKLSKYKRWVDVENVTKGATEINSDFILQDTQMRNHIVEFQMALDQLWEKPIKDLTELLFLKQNKALLTKYNLSFLK